MTTYLNVPFRDRAEAKARGARWDSEVRKWFVPIGRDLVAFTNWLPVDPAKLAGHDLTASNNGIPLSRLLAGVTTAVQQAFRQGVWTTAEVVRVDGDPHVYLELAERDTSGSLLAKARAIVWERDAERVLRAFQDATGVRLAAGIKVLVRARPEFSAQYGLTLHVDAIDPSYTLGDLEARKRRIRDQLKADGIFERNRELPAPWDYRALLVVSPPRAAGLGDFARDADHLQRHGLCEAVYAHSRFEGEGAPASIREAIEKVMGSWPGQALPDAIVIIRGGGAVNDLAWLDDYELARFVCLSPVPVLTGIGHERDSTILDEVAHQRFDTPSKVVASIQALIVKRARESQASFDEVAGLAFKQLRTGQSAIDQVHAGIRQQAHSTVVGARAAVQAGLGGVQQQAQRALHDAAHEALQTLSDVRATASGRLATARVRVASLMAQVKSDAAGGVRLARHSTGEARADVVERSKRAAVEQRQRAQGLFEEVERLAHDTLRRGAETAEAAFREVVAQGPEKTLGRGFAVVHTATGRVVTNAASARQAADVRVQFVDGTIKASVRRDMEDT